MNTSATADLSPPPAEFASDAMFRALLRACGLIGRVLHPFFARFGISPAQWGILIALRQAEQETRPGGQNGQEGLRLRDLSERLLIRPPSITGTVDRLQRQGLVARDPSPTDLRAKQVRLTEAGRRVVQRVLAEHPLKIREVLAGLKEPEQRQMQALLEKLAEHLEAVAEGGR